MVEFLLDNEQIRIEKLAGDTTLLDFLRQRQRRTGTKEGCASGDCGACTVVLVQIQDGALRYQQINSCITLLGSLHGKQLLTIESLAGNGPLHPVQQAFVEQHASQCGFCTPGFVMSAFALYQQQPPEHKPSRHEIESALAGNLCRCTGYRPLVAAAEQACAQARRVDAAAAPDTQQTIEQLQALATHTQTITLSDTDSQFHAPGNSADLADLLAQHPDARLVAGSTDLALEYTQGLKRLPCLISTARVEQLRQIHVDATTVSIGAAVTYREATPELVAHWPNLAELINRIGSAQVRNQGTIGGNIGTASPIGDMLPVLVALNADIELESQQGRRRLPIDGYFTGYRQTQKRPDEFIRTIHIPRPGDDEAFYVYKVSKRIEDDISSVCFAAWIRRDGPLIGDIKIACGGLAAIPKRAPQMEQILRGQDPSQINLRALSAAVGADFDPMSDVRASREYRLKVTANLIQRLCHECVSGSHTASRVY